MNLFNYRSAIRRKISGGGIFILLMLATGQVLAQSKAVSGTVKSQQGEPLTGVTILIEGTTQGTSTDAQGAFTLQAKPDDMLAVSYLGYKSQRVKVGTRTKLEVVLTEDQNLMDEVVVVGYGTQRRRNIVGAVENISGEVLENRPNAYLLRSIQGQIPGLNITMADGKPSRSASINIRANTQSIGAGGSALCLIDGVEGDLTAMNPEDVESISVLKDAASASIYGSRAANGVIIITTKKAKEGQTRVNINGSFGFKSVTDKIALTDAEGFKLLYNEQLRNEGNPEYNFSDWTGNTNWQDEIFQTGFITNNNISYTIAPSLRQRAQDGEAIIAAPAGLDAEFRFPAREIIAKYRSTNNPLSVINELTFSLPADYITNDYGIAPPQYLLMVKKSRRKSFFENADLNDSQHAFYATYNAARHTYEFGSMRNYIITLLNQETISDEDVDFVITPVSISFETNSNSWTGQSSTTVSSIVPYVLGPAMCRLRFEDAKIKFTYSQKKI